MKIVILVLPKVCRPQSTRHTKMPCHGRDEGSREISRSMVCHSDFHSDGTIIIAQSLQLVSKDLKV